MEACRCPICYETMNDVNVCVTTCKHKFHTDCLMMSGSASCPLCRTNIISSQSRMPIGSYNINEFLEEFKKEMRRGFEEATEAMKEIDRQEEEEYKNHLKKNDINKYKLLYGDKKK